MSSYEASDSVVAMLIDGEEEEQEQTDGQNSRPDCPESLPSSSDGGEQVSRKRAAFTVSNAEGLNCPICIEPWESQGAHQIWLEDKDTLFLVLLERTKKLLENYLVYALHCVEISLLGVVFAIMHTGDTAQSQLLDMFFFFFPFKAEL